MKKILVPLIIILVIVHALDSKGVLQTGDLKADYKDSISKINKKVKKIEDQISNGNFELTRSFINPPPCEILQYFINNELRKIEVGCGDVSPIMTRDSYYFDDELILAVNKKTIYNVPPIYEGYDSSKTVNMMELIYFTNKMQPILWIDSSGSEVKDQYVLQEKSKEVKKALEDIIWISSKIGSPTNRQYSGTSSFMKELILSGNEKELFLDYDFFSEPDKLIVISSNGKEIYNSGMRKTNGKRNVHVPLNGANVIVLIIRNNRDSHWWINVKVE